MERVKWVGCRFGNWSYSFVTLSFRNIDETIIINTSEILLEIHVKYYCKYMWNTIGNTVDKLGDVSEMNLRGVSGQVRWGQGIEQTITFPCFYQIITLWSWTRTQCFTLESRFLQILFKEKNNKIWDSTSLGPRLYIYK